MNISIYQFDPFWQNKIQNKNKILDYLGCIDLKSDVLIFPEMTLTGFTMNSKKYCEKIIGDSFNFFKNIAEQFKVHIIAGIIENENEKYFNTLLHINREGVLQNKYRKIHPFSFTGENRHYQSGTEAKVTEIDQYSFGLSICYDLRFPELYRQYGKIKADAIINIANWPVQRIEHWDNLLKARAIENLCYMIGVNRVGRDKGNKYSGQSVIYDPLGKEVLRMGNTEIIKTKDISMEEIQIARDKFPFLNDIKLL